MKKRVLVLVTLLVIALSSTAFAANVSPVSSLDMENLSDCILSVGFNISDVTDKEMFVCLYEDVAYDIVDIAQLQVGDTIETGSGDVVVASIETAEDGSININGGMDGEGITLYTFEDSNGYFLMDYEFIAKNLRGQAQLTFADTVTINVYKMADDLGILEEGYDTVTVPAAEVASKLIEVAAKLGEDFSPFQTSVTQENGLLTEITIDYMP